MTHTARSTAALRRYLAAPLFVAATLTATSCAQNPQVLDTSTTADSVDSEPTASDVYPTAESTETESSSSSKTTSKPASPQSLAEDPYLAPNAFIPEPGEDTSAAPTRVVPEGHVSDQSMLPNWSGSGNPSWNTGGEKPPQETNANTGADEPKPPTEVDKPESQEPQPPAGPAGEGATTDGNTENNIVKPSTVLPDQENGAGTTTAEGQPAAPAVPETNTGSTEPAAPTAPASPIPTASAPTEQSKPTEQNQPGTTSQSTAPKKRLPWKLSSLPGSAER